MIPSDSFNPQHRDSVRHWLARWLLLTVVVSGTGLLGIWEGGALTLYDRMVRFSVGLAKVPIQVVLMEGGEEAFDAPSEAWRKLLTNLTTMGASRIVLLDSPRQVGQDFYHKSTGADRLVLGLHPLRTVDMEGLPLVGPLPADASGLSVGLIHPGPIRDGFHRRQFTFVTVTGRKEMPTLEVAARQLESNWRPSFHGGSFLVNFMGGYGALPRIDLTSALGGNLVADLVRDRAVVIGMRDDRLQAGMNTPVSPDKIGMSPAEFHAFSLNSLLTDAWVREGALWLSPLLVALVVLVALLAYHKLPDQWSAGVALGGAGLYLLMGWVALVGFYFHLPMLEAAVAHLLAFLVMLQRRRQFVRERIIRILRRLSGHLKEGLVPASFHESDQHWNHIVTMVSQLLHMQRVMFLERIPGDHRLREVATLQCSLDDIIEMRRDYERTPYSTAIEKNGPLRLEKPYLSPRSGGEEVQYIMPLPFGGEIMGFWAFTLNLEEGYDQATLEQSVEIFGGQIAEMLYHRRNWRKNMEKSTQGLGAWLGREGGDAALVNEINQSALSLEERLSGMEEVFHGQETGTILYNLFGQVLHVNRRMSQLAEVLRILPFEMTVADLIMAVSGLELRKAREILRQVTLEQESFFLPVTLRDQGGLAFVLQIRPLLGLKENVTEEISRIPGSVFPVKGILIELADVSQIRRFQELRELLVENLFNQFRNDLESILMASEMLTGMDLSKSDRAEIGGLLKSKVAHTVQIVEKAESKLAGDLTPGELELFPVSLTDALEQAVRNLERAQSERRVGVELHLPRILSLALAVPNRVVEMFEGILAALLSDAAEQTNIVVHGEEKNCRITLRFSNTGFGIPDPRFQAYLSGEENPTSEEFRHLRRSWCMVEAWGGRVGGASAVGRGLRVEIELDVFICQT